MSLSIDLSNVDINNLLETLIDIPNSDLVQIESCREKIEKVVNEAVNEHIDRLFVEPNKHLAEHHKNSLSRICSDHKHLIDSV